MARYVLHLTQEENIMIGAGVVRRLVELGSGDAALLYLCLARRGSSEPEKLRAELRWDESRYTTAENALRSMGLVSSPLESVSPADAAASLPNRAYTQDTVTNWQFGQQPLTNWAAGQTSLTNRESGKKSAQDPEAMQNPGLDREERESKPKQKNDLIPPSERREEPVPEYSRADVMDKLEQDQAFSQLLHEIERKMGRLTVPSLQKLLGLYDHLGLPTEVIYLLVNYCVERTAALRGEGRLPTMREIEREGYAWARMELFDADSANTFIRQEEKKRCQYPEYMEALRFEPRTPVSGEIRYFNAWLDMGFPAETVALAYEKTVLNCHELRMPYLNGILKRWHEKGIHTPDEVKREQPPAHAKGKVPKGSYDKNAWMDEYIT